jgi:hypothetical protein
MWQVKALIAQWTEALDGKNITCQVAGFRQVRIRDVSATSK